MRLPVLILAGLAFLAGCEARTTRESSLTISGPRAEVERFIESQTGRHPGVLIGEMAPLASDQSTITLTVTEPATGADVTELTKAAIAARLNTAFESG